ncbi:MAG TPA: DUF4180 domain-containing protein [Thermotogota bacterium]|nr:DUF4180 domain-containing protein [Thermotogota bacterium]HRW91498.1 DUF4180 domain-containing protein [Thermotogota bacterium]
MHFFIREDSKSKFLETDPTSGWQVGIEELLDLMVLHGDRNLDFLVFHPENLDSGFFDLKTGIAGEFLQKMINYRVPGVFLVPLEKMRGKFLQMASEANSSKHFRFLPKEENTPLSTGFSPFE